MLVESLDTDLILDIFFASGAARSVEDRQINRWKDTYKNKKTDTKIKRERERD